MSEVTWSTHKAKLTDRERKGVGHLKALFDSSCTHTVGPAVEEDSGRRTYNVRGEEEVWNYLEILHTNENMESVRETNCKAHFRVGWRKEKSETVCLHLQSK